MKRLASAALALALVALAVPAGAQVTLSAAGGVTFPMGEYKDYAKTGWLAHAGVSVPLGASGLGAGVDGYFGSNKHDEALAGVTAGDKTNLYGVMGNLAYAIDTGSSLTPTLFGLVGSMTHAYKSTTGDDSATSLAYGGGAALGFPLGSIGGNLEAWFISGSGDNSDTRVFGVDLGVQIPLGGGM